MTDPSDMAEDEANEALASFMEGDIAEVKANSRANAPPVLPDPIPPNGITCLQLYTEIMAEADAFGGDASELSKKLRRLYRTHLVPIVDFYESSRNISRVLYD